MSVESNKVWVVVVFLENAFQVSVIYIVDQHCWATVTGAVYNQKLRLDSHTILIDLSKVVWHFAR